MTTKQERVVMCVGGHTILDNGDINFNGDCNCGKQIYSKEVNYIVTTQGWSGKKVTPCNTKSEVWVALDDCSLGALTSVSSPTGKTTSDFVPF